MQGLQQRDVVDADRDALWRLHVDTMRDYVSATYGWDDALQEAFFDERWRSGRDQRVLVDGPTIVASWRVERRVDEHFLTAVRVAPSYQGRGIGRSIVESVLAEARERGTPAALTVMKANPRARRLYERCGFRVCGETETHHRMVAVPPA